MSLKIHIPRWLYKILGFSFLACGIVGAVLPLLPTTPMLLLALFCFNQSSPKMKFWIINHPWLGPPILRWQEKRTVSLKVKVWALSMMSISIATSLWFLVQNLTMCIFLVIVWTVSTFFLLRLPSDSNNI